MFTELLRKLSRRIWSSRASQKEMPIDGGSRIWPLPIGEGRAWIEQAQTITPFVCDAAFSLEPDFYFGPGNDFTRLEWETSRVNLPVVTIPCQFNEYVTTAEAFDQECALIAYYCRIVEIAAAHGKSDSLKTFPYFRIKPVIIANGQVLTDFSWNDDLHETTTILQHLIDAAHGPARLVHVDEDQQWHIQIATTGASTCLIEWEEGRCPPIGRGYAFNPTEMAGQAVAALERLQTIHRRLVKALGKDYWD